MATYEELYQESSMRKCARMYETAVKGPSFWTQICNAIAWLAEHILFL